MKKEKKDERPTLNVQRSTSNERMIPYLEKDEFSIPKESNLF
jgi:hypothetical protein